MSLNYLSTYLDARFFQNSGDINIKTYDATLADTRRRVIVINRKIRNVSSRSSYGLDGVFTSAI